MTGCSKVKIETEQKCTKNKNELAFHNVGSYLGGESTLLMHVDSSNMASLAI